MDYKRNSLKILHFYVEVLTFIACLLTPQLWGGSTEQGFALFSGITLVFGDYFWAVPKKVRKSIRGLVSLLWGKGKEDDKKRKENKNKNKKENKEATKK